MERLKYVIEVINKKYSKFNTPKIIMGLFRYFLDRAYHKDTIPRDIMDWSNTGFVHNDSFHAIYLVDDKLIIYKINEPFMLLEDWLFEYFPEGIDIILNAYYGVEE